LGIELVIITTHSTVLEKSKRWFFNRKYYEIRFDTISEAFLELGKNNIVSMGTEIQQLKNALNTQYLVSIG
jgi:hypothetical protein